MAPNDDTPDTRPASALVSFDGTAEPERDAAPWYGLLDGFRGVTRWSVIRAFLPYTVGLEAALGGMYCDTLGLVTTAIGNLLDFGPPESGIAAAQRLPWLRPDGTAASPAEVAACWRLVKSRQDLAPHGGAGYLKIPGNNLRLDRAGVALTVCRKLEANDADLAARFVEFPEWPADAQLGIHSMSWAMGDAFHFPNFERYVRATPPNFLAAAPESHMSNGAPPRNAAQRAMFENAARVIAGGLDPDVLIYVPPKPPAGNWLEIAA